jgi:Rod binding domain-containing protein
MGISGIGAPALASQSLDVPDKQDKKVSEAAGQFESLLIAQMLKSMRESESGWLGTGEEDSAGETAMGMAEEHLATALSAAGGLGLSQYVNSQLKAPDLSGNVDVGGAESGGAG